MKTKPAKPERSCSELCRIRAIAEECKQINYELQKRGQHVASWRLDAAIDELRKTIACWNDLAR